MKTVIFRISPAAVATPNPTTKNPNFSIKTARIPTTIAMIKDATRYIIWVWEVVVPVIRTEKQKY